MFRPHLHAVLGKERNRKLKDLSFYQGKRVLMTGHTGFKGTWLTKMLINAGANVVGYALKPKTKPNLFELSQVNRDIIHLTSMIADIRHYDSLLPVFQALKPEIVFHLAAQPIVLTGYEEPKYTYETNVLGTVNVLECIRVTDSVKTLVNVTTDKVYENPENGLAFVETDRLNGFDPYSNSKSCSELVTECYYNSFLKDKGINVITMRAGNVIGGGDYAENRIVPDCVRAATVGQDIVLRNPNAVRPFQHVLEPLYAYLLAGSKTFDTIQHFNIGPADEDCITTRELAELFCKYWPGANYVVMTKPNAPHEAGLLKLNCDKIQRELGWKPTWNVETAIQKVCEFHKARSFPEIMDKQIEEFLKGN